MLKGFFLLLTFLSVCDLRLSLPSSVCSFLWLLSPLLRFVFVVCNAGAQGADAEELDDMYAQMEATRRRTLWQKRLWLLHKHFRPDMYFFVTIECVFQTVCYGVCCKRISIAGVCSSPSISI